MSQTGFFKPLPNKKISEDLSLLALGFLALTILNSCRNFSMIWV